MSWVTLGVPLTCGIPQISAPHTEDPFVSATEHDPILGHRFSGVRARALWRSKRAATLFTTWGTHGRSQGLRPSGSLPGVYTNCDDLAGYV